MSTVAIDYTPAIRQSAGIGRIIRGQVDALLRLWPDIDARLLVVGKLSPSQHQSPLPLHDTPLSERNMVRLWHRLGSPWPTIEMFTGGPLDLFHATDFVMAPNRARRTIVTVHDLAFIHYPDASHPNLYRYLNVVVPKSIRKADHIIADSYHTAKDVHELFDIPAEDISVVQGAVDRKRFNSVEDQSELATVRRRYAINDQPYIFGLSSLQPRKNFVRLIEAYALARESGQINQQLVIGGAKGWLYDEIFAKVAELKLEDHVHFTGFIDDADLPVVYRAADCFAFPSLYEGFGLPILEALACGTPVLTADNSCLPEAAGAGAVYADAEDVDSIADGLVRLCTDATLRRDLVSAGRTHIAQFTWENSAEQLKATYERVIAS